MCGALTLLIAFIFIPFFAQNIQTILAGVILQGYTSYPFISFNANPIYSIPFGVFQTLTTTYASEVMPVALRAYATTYVNLCWVFGQLTAAVVLVGYLGRNDQWAYRMYCDPANHCFEAFLTDVQKSVRLSVGVASTHFDCHYFGSRKVCPLLRRARMSSD